VQGLYVHVPFCFHKCHYCDFYSIVDHQDRRAAFTARLIEELTAVGRRLTRPLDSIFVGGGTPTLLSPGQWHTLLKAIGQHLPLAPDLEFTVEANPETVDLELAQALAAGGVNRCSIGAQSFHEAHLRTLERHHEPASVARSVTVLRQAGIAGLNLDLIFAIPGQTHEEWIEDLDAALALKPDHLSCYALTYEPNTPMTARLATGAVQRAPEALEARMYETTLDRLDMAGMSHYEISAWAHRDRQCRHNLLYWSNGDWWPAGPGAAGHVQGVRWRNTPRLADYLDAAPWPSIQDVERLDADGRVGEEFMLGLRLIDGLTTQAVDGLLASGQRGRQRQDTIQRCIAQGLLQDGGGRLRFTRRGLLLADSVLAELV
jgi:oxygen-independent coproporphyrinogen-3 oxidase